MSCSESSTSPAAAPRRGAAGLAKTLLWLVLAGSVGLVAVSRIEPREVRGIAQERLDTATPSVSESFVVGQTFTCPKDGLQAVELLVVLYDPDRERPASARLFFTLEDLSAENSGVPLSVEAMAGALEHNQSLRFSFAPIDNSVGRRYRITVGGDADHGIAFWYSATEALADGERWDATGGQDAALPGDLYLVTHHRYDLASALGDAVSGRGAWRGRDGPARRTRNGLALLLVLALPGLALLQVARPSVRTDLGSGLALILCASLAMWPLLFLWTTAWGIAVRGPRLWGLILLLLLACAHVASQRGRLWLPWDSASARLGWDEAALALILVLGWATRLTQVRDLVVPNWVDGVHHTLITQLIAESGKVPDALSPYLPIDGFHYHFGFHAVAAAFVGLSGLSSAPAVLLFGQVLNVLAGLAAYALASTWSRRRWAGVVAALVVTLLSYMPAYYVSWGRYTQLAGLVLLPTTAISTQRWLEAREPRVGGLLLAGCLVAGLGVTHYRVVVLYAALLPLLMLVAAARGRSLWRPVLRAGAMGVAAGILGLPWVLRMALRVAPAISSVYGGLAANEALDTAFSTSLLEVGWTPILLKIAAVGLLWALVRRRGEMVILGLWCGLCLLVANPRWLGLPNTWLIHSQSVVIAYWLPVGVLCGWVTSDVACSMARGLARLTGLPWLERLGSGALGLAVLYLAIIGAWRRVDAVNPVTVLVTPGDVEAIAWCDESLPDEALVLINSGRWQGELRAGNDAGWWLPILARRQVTMPCVLYAQGPPSYTQAVNDLSRAVEEAGDLDGKELLEVLEHAGVTHVFVGSRGGKLIPEALDPSPHYEALYVSGPARVYRFVPELKPQSGG